MTVRDATLGAILFVVFCLWMGDRGELSKMRGALIHSTGEVIRLTDQLLLSEKAWMDQHEQLKASIKGVEDEDRRSQE